jgi:hypothetical protein
MAVPWAQIAAIAAPVVLNAVSGGKNRSEREAENKGELEATQKAGLGALREDVEGLGGLLTGGGATGLLALLGLGGTGTDSLDATSPLADLIQTGVPSDVGPLFEAAKSATGEFIDENVAALGESFGPEGLRFGTDRLNAEARLREEATEGFGRTVADIGFQADEAAQARRLQAIRTAQELFGGARESGLQTTVAAANQRPGVTLPSAFQQSIASGIPGLQFALSKLPSGGKKTTDGGGAPGGFGSLGSFLGGGGGGGAAGAAGAFNIGGGSFGL